MSVRRSLIVPLAVLLGLTAVGCGDDNKDSAKSTTTVADSATTTVAPTGGSETSEKSADTGPTTTISAADFDAGIATANAALDAAGTDFCKIASAANKLTVDTPSTPEQAKALYETYASIFTKIADSLPLDSKADAATLKAATAKMLADAEASNYDPSKLSGSQAPAAFADEAVTDTMDKVGESIGSTCSGAANG